MSSEVIDSSLISLNLNEAIEKFGRLNHLQWKSVDHGREDLVHCEVDQ